MRLTPCGAEETVFPVRRGGGNVVIGDQTIGTAICEYGPPKIIKLTFNRRRCLLFAVMARTNSILQDFQNKGFSCTQEWLQFIYQCYFVSNIADKAKKPDVTMIKAYGPANHWYTTVLVPAAIG